MEKFFHTFILGECKNRMVWRKSKKSLSKENRWLHNSTRQTRKVMCWTITCEYHASFSLDRYYFCAHCGNRASDKPHPQKLSLQQEIGLEMDTEDRNPSGVGSTMEMELFPPWGRVTLIYWLYSSFRIHLPAFHYELCSFTSLLSHSMENVSMLKNNILLACFCCCFFYVGDEAIMALLPLSHIQSLKSLFWINHRIMNSPLHKAINTWF